MTALLTIVVFLTLSCVLPAIGLRYNLTQNNCQVGYVKCELGEDVFVEGEPCIKACSVCDGKFNCTDGSDEKYCLHNYNYGRTGFTYKFVTVLSISKRLCRTQINITDWETVEENRICDSVLDCRDGSDESFCPYNITAGLFHYEYSPLGCLQGYVNCKTIINKTFVGVNKNCIKKDWICDGNQDCSDGSDEKYCPYFFDFDDKSTTNDYTSTDTSETEQDVVFDEPTSNRPAEDADEQIHPTVSTWHYINTVLNIIIIMLLILIVFMILYHYQRSTTFNQSHFNLKPINILTED